MKGLHQIQIIITITIYIYIYIFIYLINLSKYYLLLIVINCCLFIYYLVTILKPLHFFCHLRIVHVKYKQISINSFRYLQLIYHYRGMINSLCFLLYIFYLLLFFLFIRVSCLIICTYSLPLTLSHIPISFVHIINY